MASARNARWILTLPKQRALVVSGVCPKIIDNQCAVERSCGAKGR